jgi:probable HAF family extracellular repeat protein
VSFVVTDLGTLGGTTSVAHGINNRGQVVGYAWTADAAMHAFLWEDGRGMQDLSTFGGTNSWAHDINNNGQVVGAADTSGGGRHAFIWENNSGMQDLGTLGGTWSEAYGVNDSGQVVGQAASPVAFLAFSWRSGSGMQNLGTLGGRSSYATDINNSGQVVGRAYTVNDASSHAFLWQDNGGMEDIDTPGNLMSDAQAINSNGQVIGFGGNGCFLWESGTGMRVLDGAVGQTWGINSSGQVVGCWPGSAASGFPPPYAYLWQEDAGMRNLNDLLVPNSGWTLTEAHDINDLGQIVGSGWIDGESHAFLLTPLPEPCSFLLLCIAAAAGLGYRWHQR